MDDAQHTQLISARTQFVTACRNVAGDLEYLHAPSALLQPLLDALTVADIALQQGYFDSKTEKDLLAVSSKAVAWLQAQK